MDLEKLLREAQQNPTYQAKLSDAAEIIDKAIFEAIGKVGKLRVSEILHSRAMMVAYDALGGSDSVSIKTGK